MPASLSRSSSVFFLLGCLLSPAPAQAGNPSFEAWREHAWGQFAWKLAAASDGGLWAGTNGGGVVYWDGPTVPVIGRLDITSEELSEALFQGLRLVAVGLAFAAYALLLDLDQEQPPRQRQERGHDETTEEGDWEEARLLVPAPDVADDESDARDGNEKGRIDADQRERILLAMRRGDKPPHQTPLGGLILIHGTKKRWVPGLTRTNWTDGCIAMENDDLQELLAAFDSHDRPIVRILP